MERVLDTVDGKTTVENSALRLVEEFAAFGPAYMKWAKSRMREGGPSYARMRLMGSLRCKGPQIMSSISTELGVTRRNVTALVDALEEEGLLRRKSHPTDRRATVIEMTERGVEKMDEMYDEHRARISEVFEGLSEEDRKSLVRILGTLRGTLRERDTC